MKPEQPAAEILRLQRRIRWLLGFFIAGLVLSGVTAFPLLAEMDLLCGWLDGASNAPAALVQWILFVREGLAATYAKYPFIGYGTDWLAFGHIVIALFFIAPWREPGRHVEVVRTGMLACVLIVPLAMICGPIRGIPFYWRLIDCSFGVGGIIPLWLAMRDAQRLRKLGAVA